MNSKESVLIWIITSVGLLKNYDSTYKCASRDIIFDSCAGWTPKKRGMKLSPSWSYKTYFHLLVKFLFVFLKEFLPSLVVIELPIRRENGLVAQHLYTRWQVCVYARMWEPRVLYLHTRASRPMRAYTQARLRPTPDVRKVHTEIHTHTQHPYPHPHPHHTHTQTQSHIHRHTDTRLLTLSLFLCFSLSLSHTHIHTHTPGLFSKVPVFPHASLRPNNCKFWKNQQRITSHANCSRVICDNIDYTPQLLLHTLSDPFTHFHVGLQRFYAHARIAYTHVRSLKHTYQCRGRLNVFRRKCLPPRLNISLVIHKW